VIVYEHDAKVHIRARLSACLVRRARSPVSFWSFLSSGQEPDPGIQRYCFAIFAQRDSEGRFWRVLP
jgi:hypothetical protein